MISILMIEDNIMDLKAFQRFLKSGDYPFECTFASSLQDGMEKIAANPFDVILVDYQLGDGTALDLLQTQKHIPIIVITGMGNEEIAITAMKMGACDYLIKDVNSNYLKIIPVTIETAIRRWNNAQLQKLLSHTMQSISEGVFITDKNDRIIFVNRAFSGIYGYTDNQICGQESSIIWQDPTDNRQSLDFVMHRTNIDWLGKVIHLKKNGESFPASVSRSSVRDENDNSFAIVGIVRDITEQQEIDQQQEQLLQDIQSTLNRFQKHRFALPVSCESGTLDDIRIYWKQLERFLETVENENSSDIFGTDAKQKGSTDHE